jgi:cold shock CspA family protein/ribosome-associated translation inhibitor RaiA
VFFPQLRHRPGVLTDTALPSEETAMDSPLEITFHNMRSSDALEADIRKRVSKLEKLYGRLISCRVSVEARTKQHHTGNIYEVHVEMHVPRGHLVVSREPHHVGERHANTDVRASIRDAFKAAEAQLRSFGDKQGGETKPHASPVQGLVAELFCERDYGFILTSQGARLYFHRNSVMNGNFDKLKRGDAVHFVEGVGDTGPTASKVWPADNGERSH